MLDEVSLSKIMKIVCNLGHPNVGTEDAADGSSQLDVPWMMEHYKQVLRLLPGKNNYE